MAKKKSTFNRRTGFLLWHVSNSWQRSLKTALDPLDLTHVQYLLLETLDRMKDNDTPATQVRLAREAGTDVMMTSKVIRVLEQKKWVTRKTNRMDARAFTLALTPNGEKVMTRARQLVIDADKNFFRNINKMEKFNSNLELLSI
jgi:DNA-binding MarR family transcriptional regulator